jgi:hypothetical protein
MSDFSIRAGSIDVEEVMRHIRTRIRDKRGVDYTEQEIRELANVKLERILDPSGIRSDLIEHFRKRPKSAPIDVTSVDLAPWPEPFPFDDKSIYRSTRGLLSLIRRLLRPVLKLMFNPNPMITVIHQQAEINAHTEGQLHSMADQLSRRMMTVASRLESRDEIDTLNFEVLNNLVVEITRLGIEVKNLKMQVQSVNSRLDFDERRARALEGLIKPTAGAAPPAPASRPDTGDSGETTPGGPRKRRRRRRGGRRRTGTDGDAARSADEAATASQPGPDSAPPRGGVDSPPPDADAGTPPATTDTAASAETKAAAPPTSEPTAPEPTTPRAPDDGAADSSEQ